MPSGTFDILSDSFNKAQLVLTILGLSVGIAVVKVSHTMVPVQSLLNLSIADELSPVSLPSAAADRGQEAVARKVALVLGGRRSNSISKCLFLSSAYLRLASLPRVL